MLTITTEQAAVLAGPAVAEVRSRIIGHLCQHWPEECDHLGPERTARAVDRIIQTMRDYGIVVEHDVRRCADLAFALENISFHAQPWAQQILTDADYPPRIKVNLLWQAVERQLQAARAPQGTDPAQALSGAQPDPQPGAADHVR